MKNTKQELIDEICNHLSISSYPISTGSTEPKDFLLAVVDQLGLAGLADGMDKAELGKLIVEASGEPWLPIYDSTGSTITREGIEAIRGSVFRLTKSD